MDMVVFFFLTMDLSWDIYCVLERKTMEGAHGVGPIKNQAIVFCVKRRNCYIKRVNCFLCVLSTLLKNLYMIVKSVFDHHA